MAWQVQGPYTHSALTNATISEDCLGRLGGSDLMSFMAPNRAEEQPEPAGESTYGASAKWTSVSPGHRGTPPEMQGSDRSIRT